MTSNIRIVFENKEKKFFPGDLIEGKVVFSLVKDSKCKGLTITFHGFCFVNSKGATSVSAGNNFKSAKEDYYKCVQQLIKGPSGDSKLPAGEHIFNFKFRLPKNIPPSYESQWGFVRHYAEAVLDFSGPFKRDPKCTEAINVGSLGLDLNKYVDSVMNPQTVLLEKDMKKFTGSCDGKLEITLTINKTGFVPGENVIINAVFANNSSKQLVEVKATIVEVKNYRIEIYNSPKPTIISSKIKKCLPATSSFNWVDEELLIPEIPILNMEGCSLIDIVFYLHFEVILNTPAQLPELQTYIPIIIGTVPLASAEKLKGNSNIKKPDNPQPIPSSLNPPTRNPASHFSEQDCQGKVFENSKAFFVTNMIADLTELLNNL